MTNAQCEADALTCCEDRALAELLCGEPAGEVEAEAQHHFAAGLTATCYLLVAL